jgi:hypothetical protein
VVDMGDDAEITDVLEGQRGTPFGFGALV